LLILKNAGLENKLRIRSLPKILVAKRIAEESGFIFEEHTAKEIHKYLSSNNLIDYGITELATDMYRNNIKYIRKGDGKNGTSLSNLDKSLNKLGIDISKEKSLKSVFNELKKNGLF